MYSAQTQILNFQVTPPRQSQSRRLGSAGKEEPQAEQTPRMESRTSKKKGVWVQTPSGSVKETAEAPGSAISKLWTAIKTGGKRRTHHVQADDLAKSTEGAPPLPSFPILLPHSSSRWQSCSVLEPRWGMQEPRLASNIMSKSNDYLKHNATHSVSIFKYSEAAHFFFRH
jgi:hypothetical protein